MVQLNAACAYMIDKQDVGAKLVGSVTHRMSRTMRSERLHCCLLQSVCDVEKQCEGFHRSGPQQALDGPRYELLMDDSYQ